MHNVHVIQAQTIFDVPMFGVLECQIDIYNRDLMA